MQKIENSKCNHCKVTKKYKVQYFFKERLVRDIKTGKDKKKIVKVYILPPPNFCKKCKDFKKCQRCEIIMCKLKRHLGKQSKNDDFCIYCLEELLEQQKNK